MVEARGPPALWRELSLRSVRGRLAALLSLAFLPAGVVAMQAGMSAVAERDAAVQQAIGADELVATGVLRDEVVQLREVVGALAANADLFAGNPVRCRERLSNVAARFPDFTALVVVDRSATVRCANLEGVAGQPIAADDIIARSAQQRGPAVGLVHSPRLSDAPVFGAVAPAAPGALGEDLYIGVTQLVAPLMERAAANSRRNQSYNLIINGDGDFLFVNGEGVDEREFDALRRRLEETPAALRESAFRVRQTWAVVATFGASDLYIVQGWRPPPQPLAQQAQTAWALLAPLLLWLAAIAAAWYAIELFVARPLSVVERLARTYARGEDAEADEDMLRNAPEEMNSLRRTLAAMAKTLRGRETRIAEALQEERALLREVHHRVKNNLQMVASILSIQSRSAADTSEARGLARAKDRVQLLALAHARIYSSGEVRDVALDQLAADVARTMHAARGAAASRIDLQMDLAPARADADRAVAFAFLIGESVSNALDAAEHAESGRVHVHLSVQDSGALVMEVSAAHAPAASLESVAAAQRLVDAFARQLNATVTREAERPAYTRIQIPPREPAHSQSEVGA